MMNHYIADNFCSNDNAFKAPDKWSLFLGYSTLRGSEKKMFYRYMVVIMKMLIYFRISRCKCGYISNNGNSMKPDLSLNIIGQRSCHTIAIGCTSQLDGLLLL
ncbi:hypothetical protein BDC45DRAFT_560723 [Circinella umbellata]|nr:hypothetical protein BDC45DRAFT_560723 [Circinella umbellata]